MSFFGVAKLYRFVTRKRGPLVRVVVFHDVPDEVWFESMIQTLTTTYHVISPEEYHVGLFSKTKINVLVTFDDGYASWLYVALPVLEKYSVKALFFVSSGLIDVGQNRKAADAFMRSQLLIAPRAPLTWEGVRTLMRRGQTIGGHARNHGNLALSDMDTCKHEIEEDKRIIEAQTSVVITDFAYPFGTKHHVNNDVCSIAKGAGYFYGYAAISRFVGTEETFLIPRMCIETELTPHALKRWVEGSYDLFDMLKQLCVR